MAESVSGGRIIRAEEIQFRISDPGFYLDGRLTAMVEGGAYDFMGRKIFTVGFFRQNVGFGITSIDVEVNTSLQPIITITFKDLYGNAMFGKNVNTELTSQITEAIRVNDQNTNVKDFSVLFNWPPPKFLFTFKGFLGKQVSWILNLKKTSTSYQSDGSYDITCEFVPNQWGFMADLPFLFLLAVKGLKKNELPPEEFKKVKTIFDLIKIGKQVEIKTKETTKEFDVLLKQMTLLKANRIVEAVAISKVIKFDQVINGSVGNLTVKSTSKNGQTLNFTDIKINTPTDDSIKTIELIKQKTSSSAEELRRVNTYLLLNADIGAYTSANIKAVGGITFEKGQRLGVLNIEANIQQRLKLINDNILIIEDAIKERTYDSSKTQLRQITIGEVFKQLSMDAGYVLGRILQAGYSSYIKNQSKRDELSVRGSIHGRQFPLTIDKTPEKKEIPAIGLGIGVEEGELAFVDQFITAVSEGIAKDLLVNNQGGGISAENALTKRINNIEAIKGNPYSPFYRVIAENIIVRSAIIAYLTRSNDPNYPGDFATTVKIDRDSIEEVLKLAEADMENITTEMLSSMADDEFLKLKQFCIFWNRFISTDGLTYLKNTPEDFLTQNVAVINQKGDPVDTTGFDGALPDSLLNRQVVIEADANGRNPLIKTLGTIINEVFSPRNDTTNTNQDADKTDASNASFINLKSFQATSFYNNGIIWALPTFAKGEDVYVYTIFEGTDATKAQEVNNASSDSETRSEDLDVDNIILPNYTAAGLVPVDTYLDSENEVLPRVSNMNTRFNIGVLKYSSISNPSPKLFQGKFTNTFAADFDTECVYKQNALIVDPNSVITDPSIQLPATNIVYSAAIHVETNDEGIIFGPFYEVRGSNSGQNHRACIKQMCVTILNKMNKIEEERNQVISDVLGKATEQREGMYKQFNTIYHQWESLMYKDPVDSDDLTSSSVLDAEQISKDFTDKYSNHKSTSDGTSNIDLENIGSNSFIYDYPLNKTANIKVADSIINLDPLYHPNGNTTVLNIIQQICTKNNFMFIPIPGNGDFSNYLDILQPHVSEKVSLKNFFYVMFAATPEQRSTVDNSSKDTPRSISDRLIENLPSNAFEVKVGSVDNKIFEKISIDTQETKTTAESIVNLQRLVDKENQNKVVTTDCSMLPVLEGRSYKASFDMVGNAQVFPMQYFYLNSIPMFNGLYQILKVKHSIKPNDMTTTAEGVRMMFSFDSGEFGGIPPITLQTLEDLSTFVESTPPGEEAALIKRFNEQPENDSPQPLPNNSSAGPNTYREDLKGFVSDSWNKRLNSVLSKPERKKILEQLPVPNFVPPVPSGSILTSLFGPRNLGGTDMHPGIDIKKGLGSPIFAAASGTVIWIWTNKVSNSGYGNGMIIKHNDRFSTVYGHLSKVLVQKDSVVKAGQKIGEEGNTIDGDKLPKQVGVHLHFEIRDLSVSESERGKFGSVNPQQYIYKLKPKNSIT